jgi:DNA-3-methyladenine glycosylase
LADLNPLPRLFYKPSAAVVAPLLLGHWLIRNTPHGPCGGPIVEVEAYLGQHDPASHSFGGETTRNRVMYGPPGHAYVYLIYGFHCCVNAVCRPAGCAEAVLIRAIEAEVGLEVMHENRAAATTYALTNGPGKLCAALAIDRKLDGVDVCDASAPLFIARNPHWTRFRRQRGPVAISARIGITKAASLPLRFHLGGSPFISRHARPDVAPSNRPFVRTNPARSKR